MTATLDRPSSEGTTVTVTVTPVDPAIEADYTPSANLELTIPAGETDSTGVVTITAVDNAVDAPNKTVTVSATAENTQGVTAPQDVTLTILDDEGPPLPELSIDDVSVTEGGPGDSATLEFTVTLNTAATEPVTETVTVDWETADGTAEAGADYTAGSGSLTFGAGETGKTVTVTVTGDDMDEPDETFTVTLSNAPGATLAKAVGTGTITDDDDEPTVTLVLTPASIAESGGTSAVTATLDHPSSAATTVTVSVAPDSPAVATDYTLSANLELTIPAGETDSTGEVTVTAVDNDAHAPDKTVTVSATAENTLGVTAPQDVTLTITDDDDSPATGTVTVTGTATEGETLTADTSGIDDEDGLDSAAWAYQWVRTPSGGSDEDISGATSQTYVPVFADAGATLKVKVTVTDDEGHEATFESAATATVEAAPRPSVTVVSDGDVTEGDTVTFTLTRTGDPAQTLDVPWAVTVEGDFGVTAGGEATATFLANDSTVRVSLATTGDSTHEAHGSVTLTLTADTSADPAWLLGDPSAATAAVADDDDSPATGTVTVTTATTFTEGETLTADTSGLADEDGLDSADYLYQWVRTPAGGSDEDISGATGETYVPVFADAGATLKVKVTVTDDEGHEAEFESAPTSTVEAGPRPSVTVASDGDVTEGGPAVFTLTRTRNTAGTLDVAYEVTATGDFGAATGASTATFLANESTVQVSVDTTDDEVHEAHGSVTVTLTADAGANPVYLLGDTTTATAAVEDDDDSPATGAVAVTGTATEGETLTADATGIADADGLDNADYAWQWVRTPSGGGDEDIAGATSQTYVPVFADAGATLKVRLTVTDDEGHEKTFESVPTSAVAALPRPSVTVTSGGDVTEGSPAVFTLSRTGDTAGTLDVDYEVTVTGDFGAATGASTATFLANDATVQVSVDTTDDGAHEAHGSVTLTLTADTGADPAWLLGAPSTATATATVADDDDSPATGTVTVTTATTFTEGETLTADTSGLADEDGLDSAAWVYQWVRTPAGGSDADISGATSQTWVPVFADVGATLKVKVTVTDDEGHEASFTSAPTSAVAAAPRPSVTVVSDGDVTEGSDAVFILTRTMDPSDELVVTFAVTGGNAVLSDEPPTEVTFDADADTARVTLETVDDNTHEADANLTLTLTPATGADPAWVLGDPSAATVTVRDDDAPTVTLILTPDTITEDGGSRGASTVTARLDRSSSADTWVDITFTPVGTPPPRPYRPSSNLRLLIPKFATASTRHVSLQSRDDDVYQGDRQVLVSGEATHPLGVKGPEAVLLTVTEDDEPPSGLSISDAGVLEGDSGSADMQFTVTLDPAATGEVTVDWATADGTATAGTDYTSGSGSLTFGAGETSKTVSVPVTGDNVDEPNETFTVTLSNPSGASLGRAEGTGTIQDDDDAPAVTLVLTPDTIAEAAGRSTVTATLDRPSSDETVVTVSVAPESPTVEGDYTLSPNPELRIAAGATTSTGEVTITAVDNAVDAPNKTLAVSATAENTQGITAPRDVTLTIRDDENVAPTGAPTIDDTTPVVGQTLTADASGIGDSDGLTGATFTWRWVRVASGGAETQVGTGATYVVVAGDVGSTLKVEASFTDDGGAEETVESAATATVEAVPLPSVTVVSDGAVTEGSPALFTLTRTGDTAGTLDVAYAVTATGDFGVTPFSGTATFQANDATVQVSVATTGDDTHEAHGSVTLTLTADTGADPAWVPGTPATATAAVEDDDAPTVSIGAPAAAVAEGETLRFPLTLNRAGYRDITLDYAVTGGTAEAGDYTDAGGGTLTIAAGDTTAHIDLGAVDDTVDESDEETVEVTISNPQPSGAATIGTATATGTITDNDAAPTVTLVLTPASITEAAGQSTVTATLDHPSSEATTVTVTVTPVAPAMATDYTPSTNLELTIPAGTTESEGVVTITAANNDVDAPDKTVTVSATATNDRGVTDPQAVTLTITDDDLVELSVDDVSVAEGDSGSTTLEFTVTLDPAAKGEVTVDWATTDGTATAGTDYASGSGSLTFGVGETSKTVTVTVTGDTVDEPNETFTVTLSSAVGATLVKAVGTGTITDDDDAPTVSVSDATAAEAADLVFPVSLSHASSRQITVDYAITPDTATSADYRGTTSGTVTFAAGVTSKNVTLDLVDDTADEPDETVTLTLSNPQPSGAATIGTATATGTITDNDVPVVTVAAETGTVREGQDAVFILTRTGLVADALVVTFTVTGGEAVLSDEPPTEATFGAGASTARVPLATDADEVDDPDATVKLTLADGDAYDLGASFAATVTVSDSADLDVGKPVVTVAAETGTVKEGEDAAFILTRTKDPSDELVVTFTVTGGDAVLSEELPTEVTFGAGASTARVPLGTENDHTHEADATLTLTLTDGDGYDLGTPSAATVTVQDDDDPPPDLSIDDVSVAEGDSGDSATMRFTVTLALAATGEVTVDWATADGTAQAGADYTSGNGRLTFSVGDTSKTVTVTVTGDDVDEPNETFTVALSSVSGATLVKATGTGTITDDDDAPAVTLVLTPASITEAAGQSTVTATLDHPSSEETTVTVSAAPESPAVAGDYTLSTDRVLTIAAGATTSTGAVTITAVDNAVDAPNKTVTVSATAENTQGITAPQDVTLTIRDDENVAPTGAPTIDDTTPVVGQTLTADPSGIVDSDGLTGATYAYRWVRVSGGTETEVGTGATYVVVAADVGSTLKVEASFTDDGGAEETVESAATAVVEAAPRPRVSVERVASPVAEGEDAQFKVKRTGVTEGALTVRYGVSETGATVASDEEGAQTVDFADGDTEQTVTVPTEADTVHEADSTVTLTLTADAAYDLGTASAEVTVEDDDDSPATGTVTVTTATTFTEGETLTADTSGLADGDGLANAGYAYQWVRTPSGGSDTDISGATGATYVPVFADAGGTLKVKVTVTDDEGHEATFTSAPTSAVAALPRPSVTVVSDADVTEGNPALFTLTRTGDTAETLDVAYTVTATGDFGVTTGASTATFLANSATVQVSVATTGDDTHEAHGSVTVTLTADTGADPAYLLGAPSTSTTAVRDDDNVAPTGVPTIDDTTPVVGQTLTADSSGIGDVDGLTGATFTWRWFRVSGGTETEVGAGSSYTVVAADVGATLKVEASFTDDGGTEETVESVATSAVEAAPRPRVSVERVASPVAEGEDAQFKVTRTGVTAGALTVRYGVSETGAMVASDEEGAKTIGFADGDTEQTVTVPTEADTVHEADSTVTLTLTADAAYDLGTATADVTVEDDDDSPATGSVAVTGTATEGETLTADTSGLTDGDGLDNAAYVYQWVRTPVGGSDADISGATGATYVPVFADVGATLKVRVTVTDDEGHEASFTSAATSAVAALPRPSVTVVSDGDVTEGNPALFTLTRTGDTAQTLDVAYAVTATGDFGAATGAGTATFLADSATVQVSVATTGDSIHEAHGTVTLTLTADAGADPAYLLGDPSTATAAVEDDDAPTVSIGAPAAAVAEGGTLRFPLTLNRAGYRDITLDYAVTGGTADAADYTDAGGGTLTIAAGDTTAHIELGAVDDTVDESDEETVEVTISNPQPSGAATIGTAMATGTITDNDAAPTVTLVLTPASITEAAGQSTVTATLDHPSSEATTVTVTVTPVAPAMADDYTLSANLALTIPAGATESEGVVTITAENNDVDAPDKTVTVSATATNDRGVTNPQDVTLTITDDDLVELSVDDVSVAEGDSGSTTMQFTVTLNPAAKGEVTVDWATSDGTARAGTDYTSGSGSLTFGVGETSKTVTVTVTGDTVDEPNETFTVSLSSVSGATLVKATGTGTITDDDDAPTVSVSDATAAEAADLVFPVSLSHASSRQITVDYAITPDTATSADYRGTTTGTVTFAAGVTSKNVTLDLVDDTADEPDETVTVTLSNPQPSGAATIGTATATGTITDNDVPVVTVAAETGTVREGQDAVFILTRTGLVADALVVTFTVTGGEAVLSDEPPTEATFGAGASTARVPLATDADEVDDPDATLTLTLADGDAYDLGTSFAATVTVTDASGFDAGDPVVTVAAETDTVKEGKDAVFLLTRTKDPSDELVVTFTVTGGDAVLSEELPTEVTFGAGASTARVPLGTENDHTHEADATLTLTLADGDGYDLGTPSAATVTVQDDDDPPPELSIDDMSVAEGDSGSTTMQFTVTLDPAAKGEVTVDWATADGTATAGTDYTSGNGRLTFSVGETSKTVTVPVTGDDVDEPNETFTVALSNVSGATLVKATGTGTITDDDDAPAVTLVLTPASITEAAGQSTVTARLDHPSSEETTVTVSAAPVSPAVAGDYTLSTDRVLTIAAGATTSTGAVTVTAVDNAVDAPNKTVTVSATAENTQGITAPQDVTLTIRDDENVGPTGAPTIDDTTPVVGQTLMVDPSGIVDSDGLTGATYAYRWVRVASGGTETEVGAGSSYTVVAADVGATLKVEASFTDDGGAEETVESAATATVEAVPVPTVSVAPRKTPVSEGDPAAEFTLTRTGDTTAALRVRISVSETGDMVSAGNEGEKTRTLPAGQSQVVIPVPTVKDSVHEADSVVTLALVADPAYELGAEPSAAVTVEDDDDSPATGTVTITGTATEGETLTADTSGIADADGLDNAAYVYQWVRTPAGGSDADISGATSQTYTPVFADVGATLKVRVTVTDDEGHRATFTSAPTSAVAALPRPSVTVASDGDVTEGSAAVFTLTRTGATAQTLDVAYEVTATGDFGVTTGAGTATFPANSATVQVSVDTTGDDTHEAHGSVTLTLTADTGSDPAYLLGDPSAATAAVEDDDDSPATGSVTVTGTPTEGETLSADTSGIADADGLANASYAYRWVRTPPGGGNADISGATSQTYTPVFADAGATLKVRVTVTDDEGHRATFTSAPTSAVAALPRPSVTVASDGDVTEGDTVTFTLTRTGDPAETLDVAYEVTATGDFGAATGAGTATFLANSATVQVSVDTMGDGAHEAHGSVTLTLTADTGADPAYVLGDPSTATAAVEDDDDSPATGVVTVTTATTFTEGETLTADTSGITDADGLANAVWAYRWVRTPPGGGNADISGATSQTYVPVFADAGATLKVRVTVTDDEGHRATFTSASTSTVAALPRPSVTVERVSSSVAEGEDAQFTVKRTGVTTGALTVRYRVDETGTMVRSGDKGAKTLDFSGNTASMTVTVPTVFDNIHERDSRVTLTLTADAAYDLGTATAKVLVKDDDDSPTTGVVTVTGTATEGETLSADTSGLTDGDGLANAAWAYQWVRTPSGGSDEDISGATSQTYVPVFADAGATLKIRVTVTDDEGHEATFTSAPTATVAALARPSVTVAPRKTPVTEGKAAEFTVTRSGDTTAALRVRISVSETGDMVSAGNEGEETRTIPAGQPQAVIPVPTVVDSVHEADSVVTLTLVADPAYELGTERSAEVTVEDDDNAAPTGTPTIDDTTPVVGETLTADASNLDDPDGLTDRSFTWQWVRTSGGTETEIAGATSASYTVAAADVGATLKVRVGFTDDDGTGETVESAPTSAAEAPSSVLTVAAEAGTVTEGEAAVFILTRSGDLSGELAVTFEVTGGDAVLSDTAPTTATFGANADTARVTLATDDDGTDETNVTLTLTLTDGDAYDLGTPSVATVTVTDDATPKVSVADAPTVTEGGTLAFPVRLSHPSATQITVAYELTITVPHWWRTELTETSRVADNVTFAVGQMQQTIRLTTVDDEAQMQDATVEVALQAGDTHELGVPSTASGTVRDNDLPEVGVWVSLDGIADVVVEGEEALIDLRREGNVWEVLEVFFTIEDAQGVLASEPPASVAFRAGENVATVRLSTRDDALDGPDSESTLTLTLRSDATYRLGALSEVGVTVQDSGLPGTSQAEEADTVVTVAAESGPVTEGEDAVFVLTRTGDAPAPLTVRVEVSEAGRVLAGTAPAEATFGESETQARLRVATEDDATAEADGRVTATVMEGTGYTVAAGAGSVGVDVLDNDAPAAPEETVTLWSTTMTVADLGGSVGASGPDLPDRGWSEGGVDYMLDRLKWFGSPKDRVVVRFNRRPPLAEELTLRAGELTLALAEGGTGRVLRWPVEGEPWSVGEEVALRLTRTAAGEDPDGAAGPGVSVADARVNESAGTPLAFRVTLDEAQSSAVSVRYATADGSAAAGADYVAASGVVRFEAGETVKTVHVAVLEDAHDEGEETMTLTLSRPFGAEVSDGTATGTIANTDAMPRAWLGRFGRTVAGQVVDAVEARMTAARQAGVEVSIAGQRVGAAGGLDEAVSRDAAAASERLAGWLAGGADSEERTVSGRELLTGTSFALTEGTAESGFVSLWGRGAVTDFDGRDGELSMDGEVATGLLGADWTRADWAAGVIVGHSRGEGSYRGQGTGTLSSSLTGLYPWGRQALNERVTLWGVAGYGEGTLALEPEDGARIDTDLDLAMAAAGLRGVLVEAPAEGGLELAAKGDALIVRSASEAAQGSDGGLLEAASAKVTRLRLGLEGTRAFRSEGGWTLTPSFGLGVRHDGGDAETGFGVDLGAGLAFADPSSGVTADLQGRGLLTHEASGFREVGFSGSLAFDPSPSSGRGLSLSLSQTLGAPASGGVDALYGRDTMAGLGGADDLGGATGDAGTLDPLGRRRLEARVGYGLSAFGGRFTGTPELGFGLSESGRDYRLGWRLTPEGGNAGSFEFSLEATRREAATGEGAEHGMGVRATMRW